MKKTKLEWQAERTLLDRAAAAAEEVLDGYGGFDSPPIDPLQVAAQEHPLLRVRGADFRNRFDGQLEYHPSQRGFLLFFNTKYDLASLPGQHHPRTRFSIAHELGHFHLEKHRVHLLRGGEPHGSASEFSSSVQIEREADSFAAALLMPQRLFRPLVNEGELTPRGLEELASLFQTSLVSAGIRAVRLSEFPCAFMGIRDDKVAWRVLSDSLVEAGCYPGKRELQSPTALSHWQSFERGTTDSGTAEGPLTRWFATYGQERLENVVITEDYIPAPIMGTLLVLITADEGDLFDVE